MKFLFCGINTTGCGINTTEKSCEKLGKNFVPTIIFSKFYDDFFSVVCDFVVTLSKHLSGPPVVALMHLLEKSLITAFQAEGLLHQCHWRVHAQAISITAHDARYSENYTCILSSSSS